MIRIQNLTFTPGADSRAALLCAAAKALRLAPDKITELRIHRRSVDARKKQDVRVVYTVDVTVDGKEEKILQMARNPKAAIAVTTIYEPPRAAQTDERPVVIGFGPGGMFAALALALAGLRPRVIRTAESHCCKWCSALAGTYDYPRVPKDVYRRHERCRCRVEYDPGEGRRQNVWNKTWTEDEDARQARIQKIQNPSTNRDDSAKIEARKQIGLPPVDSPEIKAIKAAMSEQVLSLPETAQEALRQYTGFTATRVNFAIRNGKITPQIQETISALDNALASGVMPQSVTLYRNTALSFLGFGLPKNPTLQDLQDLVDLTPEFPIFISTSFQDLHLPGRDTLIQLHVPAGYKGCQFLQPVALPKFKSQDEVLFARGMQYRVLDVGRKDDRYFLEIEVLQNV